jgi:hypothetical protein
VPDEKDNRGEVFVDVKEGYVPERYVTKRDKPAAKPAPKAESDKEPFGYVPPANPKPETTGRP